LFKKEDWVMFEIDTPYRWMAGLAEVPLIGGFLVLCLVIIPGMITVALLSIPFGVNSRVGTPLTCLVSAVWALLLHFRLRTKIRFFFIPLWLLLPVLGVLGLLKVLN
jgi:hypothetical protein